MDMTDIVTMVGVLDSPQNIVAFYESFVLKKAKDAIAAKETVLFCLREFWRDDECAKKRIKMWEEALRPYFEKTPDVLFIKKEQKIKERAQKKVESIKSLVENISNKFIQGLIDSLSNHKKTNERINWSEYEADEQYRIQLSDFIFDLKQTFQDMCF